MLTFITAFSFEKVFSWSACSDRVIFNRALVVYFCSDLEDSVIVGNSRNYLRILRSWLSPVARSVNSAWKHCWRASVDGWAASTFHSRCDGKGPTVTIIRVGRYIFGGYTSVSWGKWTLWTGIIFTTVTNFVIKLKTKLYILRSMKITQPLDTLIKSVVFMDLVLAVLHLFPSHPIPILPPSATIYLYLKRRLNIFWNDRVVCRLNHSRIHPRRPRGS